MDTPKRVVVIAGPAGSGKDSVARELVKRFPNVTMMVTATTRAMRPGEQNGVNYHFFSNEQFKKELEAGNIPEHYHRVDTDTYYGTYEPDIDRRLETGKIVLAVVQIVGAKYLKEKYDATTIFIMPPSLDAFEKRVRARSPMSDIEWQERIQFTQNEVVHEAPWYDYRISNEDGKLPEAVDEIVGILKKEGYTLD
jgi:guanylate kinase